MEQEEKTFKIGDYLIAIKSFFLTDNRNNDYYYSQGDEFIIMNIHYKRNDYIKLDLNTKDSVFNWIIGQGEGAFNNDMEEFKEYLVLEKEYKRIIRHKKLKEINGI